MLTAAPGGCSLCARCRAVRALRLQSCGGDAPGGGAADAVCGRVRQDRDELPRMRGEGVEAGKAAKAGRRPFRLGRPRGGGRGRPEQRRRGDAEVVII